MSRPVVCLLALLLSASAARVAAAELKRVVFEGVTSNHQWPLNELNPELPSDWSSYEYLVLEARVSSPQRFFLNVFNAGGIRRVRLHPFGQNVWFRA